MQQRSSEACHIESLTAEECIIHNIRVTWLY